MRDRPGSEAVVADLRKRLAAKPDDAVSWHNLGVEMRRLGRFPEAYEAIERAISLGLAAPETGTMRAHILGDLGRFDEAVTQYRAVLAAKPDMIDAQEVLAKLLPQLGRSAEALDGYRGALAVAPDRGALWVSALGAARAQGDYQQLLAWAEAAEQRFGKDTMITVFAAQALSSLDEDARALDILRPAAAAEPDYAPARTTLAHIHLKRGELVAAEEEALAATAIAPEDQSAWSLLTVIWRLRGDAREEWLAGYDRLVMAIDLPNFDQADLTARLTALHEMREAPGDQSLRGGTQTRGELFLRPDPALQALAKTIRAEVMARLSAIPADANHPFLRRRSAGIDFTGSWSVRLKRTGFHVNHIHQEGWLSSALHVRFPAPANPQDTAGALTFGIPDAALGLNLAPRRVFMPVPGRLIVFPSYVWHGTIPFDADEARLTVAFDAVPT